MTTEVYQGVSGARDDYRAARTREAIARAEIAEEKSRQIRAELYSRSNVVAVLDYVVEVINDHSEMFSGRLATALSLDLNQMHPVRRAIDDEMAELRSAMSAAASDVKAKLNNLGDAL